LWGSAFDALGLCGDCHDQDEYDREWREKRCPRHSHRPRAIGEAMTPAQTARLIKGCYGINVQYEDFRGLGGPGYIAIAQRADEHDLIGPPYCRTESSALLGLVKRAREEGAMKGEK
jgi:hypothetical protein